MTLEETIIQYINELPESEKAELLSFVEYLHAKAHKRERNNWTDLSLSSAMRGMEDEEMPYSLNDLRESFS